MSARRLLLCVALSLGGCSAHANAEQRARVRLLQLANELDRDPKTVKAKSPELHMLATRLRTAAAGRLRLSAEVRQRGPLGSEVWLTQDPDGWKVQPESVAVPSANPRAAVEQLIVALDRLESDPALAILTRSLHGSLVQASRERADGLRALLPRISAQPDGTWPLHFEYGGGLFVLVRPEDGQWRVDDFN
ncbi:MAG: hypothetical protein ABI321_20135 [Polyangia bacterium]